ncbi:MAG: UDP-N-acetylmuramate--L-alanine ligase [Chloroflexi bacterium]|nr:UDP-N-acetylmuramate--L-alanine ligase [Chloroflexota bacterium]
MMNTGGDFFAGHTHFVGIGGIGLSAMARVLLERGHQVSGSDLHLSPLTDELRRLGATIYQGHEASHVHGADRLIVSSAIRPENPEVLAAREMSIPVYKRDETLPLLMQGQFVIAVAGTHGKTTTAAMIALILAEAGFDPGFIVGGILRDLGTNGYAGGGRVFVVEADEYDRTFLGLKPDVAVVTGVEMDHPDCFRDLEEMAGAFADFLHLVPQHGLVVGCTDDPIVARLMSERRTTSAERQCYGFHCETGWSARSIVANEIGGANFTIRKGNEEIAQVQLQVPGRHNVLNALAAWAVGERMGVPRAQMVAALRRFSGVARRFEEKGTVDGIVVVDDYAHHPTQIQATLAAARARFPNRPIWAFFQPHTYSRTRALLPDFAASFANADHVIVSAIFAAREPFDPTISGADLVAAIHHPDARYIETLEGATEYLAAHLAPGDVLLTLGAGDGYRVGEELLKRLGAT